MIWLTWRQHRAQMLATAALLLALGLALLVSGVEAVRYVADHAPPGCPGSAAECHAVNAGLSQRYGLLYQSVFGLLPLLGPALIGAFWGAPLVSREYERGTHQLAWTQSVSLRRWLGYRVGLPAAVVVVAGLALSAMTSAWLSIFDDAVGSAFGNPGMFNLVGVASAAWWLFAFVLGVAAGALLRRTLPAMAVTFAVIALAFPMMVFTRDGYAEPLRAVATQRDAVLRAGGVLAGAVWIGPSGDEIAAPPPELCPQSEAESDSWEGQLKLEDCLARLGYLSMLDYHPATRFWRFQWIQAGILLLATLAAGALATTWTLRRRH